MAYSYEEKERIFIKRTQEMYPDVWKDYLELIAREKMSVEELHAYNFNKRKETLKYAYENTRFYKNFYDTIGLHPDDIKNENDWDSVPVVTKQMVRERYSDMIVGGLEGEDLRKYGRAFNTGGSTGKPLLVYNDRRFTMPGCEWRARGWWLGRKPGEVESTIPVLGQNEGWVWRVNGAGSLTREQIEKNKKLFWPMERFYLDAHVMGEDEVRRFSKDVAESGIYYLYGYAGAIFELACYYADGKVERKFQPKMIETAATPLTTAQRRFVEQVFDCPAYDMYGSMEASWMGIETPRTIGKDRLFVPSDLRHIDVVDEVGASCALGCEGTVCVTVFTNHVMPFVKYSLGDRASMLSEGGDGLPFPLISRIKGRETDYCIDRNGAKVFGMNGSFDAVASSVRAYQFVQKSPGVVVMKVVPDRSSPRFNEDIHSVLTYWQQRLIGRIEFHLEIVESIPHDGGKIRFIVYE